MDAYSESIVKMSDNRLNLRRIFDLAVTLVLLVVGAVGVMRALAIAATLQELRTLEPITLDGHPDLEIWRCPGAIVAPGSSAVADAEAKTRSSSAPGAERSANCAPGGRQARPQ